MGKAGVIVDDNDVGEVGVFVVDNVGGQTWPSPSLSTQPGVVDDVTLGCRRWTWGVINVGRHQRRWTWGYRRRWTWGHRRRRGMWGQHRT